MYLGHNRRQCQNISFKLHTHLALIWRELQLVEEYLGDLTGVLFNETLNDLIEERRVLTFNDSKANELQVLICSLNTYM